MESDSQNDILFKLAKRVKELRLGKKLTQEEAYNDTGIHFGRIEQGKRDISFTTLKKLCDYLDVSMEDFVKF